MRGMRIIADRTNDRHVRPLYLWGRQYSGGQLVNANEVAAELLPSKDDKIAVLSILYIMAFGADRVDLTVNGVQGKLADGAREYMRRILSVISAAVDVTQEDFNTMMGGTKH